MQDLGRIGFSEDQASLLEVATAFCREKSPVAKARRLIGFEAQISLDEGLRRLVGWWQENRALVGSPVEAGVKA